MNPSETNNVVSVLVLFLAPIAAKYGIDNSTLATATGLIVGGAAGVWMLYSHFNMKKVPERAVVTAIAPTAAEATAQSIPAAK